MEAQSAMLPLCIAAIEKHDLSTAIGWLKLKYPPEIYGMDICVATGIGASGAHCPLHQTQCFIIILEDLLKNVLIKQIKLVKQDQVYFI